MLISVKCCVGKVCQMQGNINHSLGFIFVKYQGPNACCWKGSFFSYTQSNRCLTCFIVQKSRGKGIPKSMGPAHGDRRGRKALSPLSRNFIKKDFHSAMENLNMDMEELTSNSAIIKRPSVRTPANYVPVWRRPLSSGKTPGGSPNQSPWRRPVRSENAASIGQDKCKVIRQPPMRFRL